MTFTTLLISLAAVGVMVGILSGLLGIGGGLVVVPILLWLLPLAGIESNIVMHLALATSLASIILTSGSSAYNHYRLGNIQFDTLRWLLPGIILGGLCGSSIAEYMPIDWLPKVFGLIVLYLSFKMFRSTKGDVTPLSSNAGQTSLHGALIGTVSSLAGIGGGSFVVPYLNRRGLDMRYAVGTSAFCGTVLALSGMSGFIYYGQNTQTLPAYSVGYVYVPALIAITVTSTLFTKVGAKWASSLPTKQLKIYFSYFLAIVAIKMLFFS